MSLDKILPHDALSSVKKQYYSDFFKVLLVSAKWTDTIPDSGSTHLGLYHGRSPLVLGSVNVMVFIWSYMTAARIDLSTRCSLPFSLQQ